MGTLGALPARGQETITLRSGQTVQATVLGTTPDGVKVQSGAAVMVEPFALVASVSMHAPAEYEAAVVAYEERDFPTALANAQWVAANFGGLPTPWARQAMLMLGDIDVSMDKLPDAEAAYQNYQRYYPAASAELNVSLARIDVAKKDYDAAKAKVDPITAEAMKIRNPPDEAGALIGRAFYVSGEIKEATGDLPGALEDYLRTVTIFTQDRVAVATAQERADALRKDQGAIVP